ncbi:MAG: response regulator [Archangium sp.]
MRPEEAVNASVVIVDDERSVASALQRELKQLGVTAVVVSDPELAEEALTSHGATAIICDKRMPTRSGIEVLVSVREKLPAVARCLLTGSLSELTKEEVDRITPCQLVGKPWSRRDLKELIVSLGLVAERAG